jgi:hypothetical protein
MAPITELGLRAVVGPLTTQGRLVNRPLTARVNRPLRLRQAVLERRAFGASLAPVSDRNRPSQEVAGLLASVAKRELTHQV